MQGLKTFIHQKRFLQEEDHTSSGISQISDFQEIEDDWSGTIDHRKVEDHRLKWQSRFDRIVYLIAAVFVVYVMYQWVVQ